MVGRHRLDELPQDANAGYAGWRVGPAQIVDPVTGEVPLWAPLYGATFGQAWKRFWRKYADFSGRASRSEFWLGYLGVFLLWFGSYLLFGILGGLGFAVVRSDAYAAPGVVLTLLSLVLVAGYIVTLIPLIAVSVRRLHDAGYPGTYYFLGFIPIAGPILLLVYLASDSNPSGAVYDSPTA